MAITNKQKKDIVSTQEMPHPTKTIKAINYIVAGILIAIGIALSVFIRWSVQSVTPLDIKNSPFPARIVNDPTGKTGGIVFLTASYCKNTHDKGEVHMSYVSASREVPIPNSVEDLPLGCKTTDIPVVIPLDLTKDQYKIKFYVTYYINPIKKNVVIDFESQKFTVGATDRN